MRPFVINGDLWRPVTVWPGDERLTDRTGVQRVATTDPRTRCVYLSRSLKGAFLERVLTHEVGHCAMVSYGLIPTIHEMVKEDYWVAAEEWVCNFIADYGMEIFHAVKTALDYPPVRKGA